MLATLSEVKASSIRNISGLCVDSAQFIQYVNDATRRLMRRGDWAGTIVPIHVCLKKGCVVWPRYVGSVRKINYCKVPIPIKNVWYDFLQYSGPHNRGGLCCWTSWCGPEARMINQYKSPTYADVMGDNRTIRAYARCQADFGKTLTIFGVDNNDQPLMTNNGDGTWSDGVVIVMSDPFGSTSVMVRRIDRVLRDATQCPVNLFAYDTVNDVLEDLAQYEPSETNPDLIRYKLVISSCNTAPGSTTQGDCPTAKSVIALVKLKFVPVVHDTDLVLIQNLDALKDMVMSLRFKEANDIENSRLYEAEAIRELNRELEDENPDDQMPADLGDLNGLHLNQQCF